MLGLSNIIYQFNIKITKMYLKSKYVCQKNKSLPFCFMEFDKTNYGQRSVTNTFQKHYQNDT